MFSQCLCKVSFKNNNVMQLYHKNALTINAFIDIVYGELIPTSVIILPHQYDKTKQYHLIRSFILLEIVRHPDVYSFCEN